MEDKNHTLGKTKDEIRHRQIDTIKVAVELTFEALEEMEKQKSILQDKIRVLKHDLYDLKDGRLDRIAERQELGGEKKISEFLVKKVENQPSSLSPWYVEYNMEVGKDGADLSYTVNNSITKMHASGTYKLKSGDIKYL